MISDKKTPVRQIVLNRLRQRHDRLGRLACDSLAPLEASSSAPDGPPDRAAVAPATSPPLTAERQSEASAA